MTKPNISPTDWHRKPKGFRRCLCPICGYPNLDGEHRATAPEENMAAKWLWRKKRRTGWQSFPVFEPTVKDTAKLLVKRLEQEQSLLKAKLSQEVKEVKARSGEERRRLLQKNRELEERVADARRKLEEAKSERRLKLKQTTPSPRVAERMGKLIAMVAHGKSVEEAAKAIGVTHAAVSYWKKHWSEAWAALMDRAEESVIISVRAMAGTDKVLDDPDKYMAVAQFADKWATKKGVELFPAPDGELTLCQFYRDWYLPNRLGDAREKTRWAYATVLRHWRLLQATRRSRKSPRRRLPGSVMLS